MKAFMYFSKSTPASSLPRTARHWLAMLVVLGLVCAPAILQAQQPDGDSPDSEVLTRGPVHEAFAGMVTFNPEPGIVITKPPPEGIEEVPPDERPEGNNVAWIPGYWAWDDERDDFLWISGTWRALPPGREWMAGYWAQTSQGSQWISGYWADTAARETTYLPPPPATVEVGPNIAAPSPDYDWTPGCWIWYQSRYAWRPGYWSPCRVDWVWMPAHYVCTPRGYIFVGGFWDFPVARRGVLFAPVYFESRVYARRGYHYSPSIVIHLGVFTDHLFLRPRYQHYYFGDYYAPSYHHGGFYASFSFQSGRHGYDPIYSHQRWEHRQDRGWERRHETSYQHRRDHDNARPPRTWAAQRTIVSTTVESQQNQVVATRFDQLAKRNDSSLRFQRVATEERQQLVRRGQEVQKSREQRRTVEAVADGPARRSNQSVEPVKVQLPRSPIVSKPIDQLGKSESPPKVPKAPKLNPKVQPQTEPANRPQRANRSTPPIQSRQGDIEKKSPPGRSGAAPRPQPAQSEPQPRANELPKRTQEDIPRNPGQAKKAQDESERRAGDAAVKTQNESQKQAQPESKPDARGPAVKATTEPQRNARASEKKSQRVSEPPVRKRAVSGEKGATQLLKKDHPGKGKENPRQ